MAKFKKNPGPEVTLTAAFTSRFGTNAVRVSNVKSDDCPEDTFFLGVKSDSSSWRGAYLTRDEAIAVRNALNAQIDSFEVLPKPTFQEQFAALETGAQFSYVGFNTRVTRKCVKVDSEQFFSYTDKRLYHANSVIQHTKITSTP